MCFGVCVSVCRAEIAEFDAAEYFGGRPGDVNASAARVVDSLAAADQGVGEHDRGVGAAAGAGHHDDDDEFDDDVPYTYTTQQQKAQQQGQGQGQGSGRGDGERALEPSYARRRRERSARYGREGHGSSES
jgi:hypothetical protein